MKEARAGEPDTGRLTQFNLPDGGNQCEAVAAEHFGERLLTDPTAAAQPRAAGAVASCPLAASAISNASAG
jgi:hypothetical protein